ncbi:MAG: hypothetical protein LBQ60_02385 [Bacteroidales bacterium]|jgi:hypothetical protein|nr:hypothetical protein [Bacteroidales bacterium]
MKRLKLVFVLCLLFAGRQLYGQCSFSYSVSGTSSLDVALIKGWLEGQMKPSYSSLAECEKYRAIATSQNSSYVTVTTTPCNCVGSSVNNKGDNTGQMLLGTADFANTQQGKGVVTTNPFDELVDGKDEYLYREKVMFGETQNTFTAQTGDQAFDEVYTWIGKSRALIHKNPNDLKVNRDIQRNVSLSTFDAMPKLQNKNGKWNEENLSDDNKGVYVSNTKDIYEFFDFLLNFANEETKPVFDMLGVENPLSVIVDKYNMAREVAALIENIEESNYSAAGVTIFEKAAETLADKSRISSTFKTIKSCFQVGKVLKEGATKISKSVFSALNNAVDGNYSQAYQQTNEVIEKAQETYKEGIRRGFGK